MVREGVGWKERAIRAEEREGGNAGQRGGGGKGIPHA